MIKLSTESDDSAFLFSLCIMCSDQFVSTPYQYWIIKMRPFLFVPLSSVDGQSCSFPLEVDVAPNATVGPLNPCDYSDDTGRSERDAVMRIAPSDTTREITVETSISTYSGDTYLTVFTACPASWYSTAWVSECRLSAR